MRRFAYGAIIVFLGLICSCFGQSASSTSQDKKSPPMKILDYQKVRSHRISEAEPLRTDHRDPEASFYSISIEMQVDEQGNVTSAKVGEERNHHISSELYDAALEEVRSWKYQPFDRDGRPVAATFTDYVRILPLEDLPRVHVPFSKIKDLASLRIALERTGCFGTCPAYRIEISGDGSVAYRGTYFSLLSGEHHDRISKEAVAQILEAFRKADYFSLRDKYVYEVTDNPTTTTSIAFDGKQKSVVDYVGEEAGMPHFVVELEETIDRLAGTGKWVVGNAETIPSLLRESWDFKSHEAVLTLMRAACDSNRLNPEVRLALVRDLISAGTPPDANEPGRSALECLAANKDEQAVILLMETGATRDNPAIKDEALGGAAAAGDLHLLRLMLKYGADPNATGRDGQTALMLAALSGIPEVVAEVLKYHPDVNARDANMQTAVYFVTERKFYFDSDEEQEAHEKALAEVVRMLIKAGADPQLANKDGNTPLHNTEVPVIAEALIEGGADVNARNLRGETPLMKSYSEEELKVLIHAGANITARDNEGHTAMQQARAMGSQDKAKFLEEIQGVTPAKVAK